MRFRRSLAWSASVLTLNIVALALSIEWAATSDDSDRWIRVFVAVMLAFALLTRSASFIETRRASERDRA
jgi:hypothetical protein